MGCGAHERAHDMGGAMAMNESARDTGLVLDGLGKRYPNGVEAVRSISLEIMPGEVFGLVGPNGAGKSTLLKLIAGLLRPERGRVTLNGRDLTGNPAEAARWIGLMPDPLGVYTDVSCREYLQFFAKIHGLEGAQMDRRIEETAETLELGPWMDEEVESLSAGWQRRLALGRMLLTEAPILLLDEPAAGLDVKARAELLEIVRGLSARGRTVVISSHILPELEELADRFGIMNQGKWVEIASGKTFFRRGELKGGLGGKRWRVLCGGSDAARRALEDSNVRPTSVEGGYEFEAGTEGEAAECLRKVAATGAAVVDFRRMDTGLSELVLRLLDEGGEV